jgi:hypothetical protein
MHDGPGGICTTCHQRPTSTSTSAGGENELAEIAFPAPLGADF